MAETDDNLGFDSGLSDQPIEAAAEGVGARGAIRGILALVLIGAATLFAVQNAESTEVSFLTFDFEISKILLMLISAVFGIAIFVLVRALAKRNSS